MQLDIGRRTYFGNPYFARKGEERQGKTLPKYQRYLDARRRDEAWAIELATRVGIPQPTKGSFEQELILLGDSLQRGHTLWCPGCREQSAVADVCHGHALRRAALDAVTQDRI